MYTVNNYTQKFTTWKEANDFAIRIYVLPHICMYELWHSGKTEKYDGTKVIINYAN